MFYSGASVDNRDGFVGCIRGLMVNGKLMDLRGMVDRGQVVYGVTSGTQDFLLLSTQWHDDAMFQVVYKKYPNSSAF